MTEIKAEFTTRSTHKVIIPDGNYYGFWDKFIVLINFPGDQQYFFRVNSTPAAYGKIYSSVLVKDGIAYI